MVNLSIACVEIRSLKLLFTLGSIYDPKNDVFLNFKPHPKKSSVGEAEYIEWHFTVPYTCPENMLVSLSHAPQFPSTN